ncbi:hypothetical protein Tco_0883799 [Tanacetum coccineum]
MLRRNLSRMLRRNAESDTSSHVNLNVAAYSWRLFTGRAGGRGKRGSGRAGRGRGRGSRGCVFPSSSSCGILTAKEEYQLN